MQKEVKQIMANGDQLVLESPGRQQVSPIQNPRTEDQFE